MCIYHANPISIGKKRVSCCTSDLGIVGSVGKSGTTGQSLYPYIDISPANTQPVDSLS